MIGGFGPVPEQYLTKDKISISGVMELLKSPLHYYYKYILKEREPDSQVMIEGRLLHQAILEPDLFHSTYECEPDASLFAVTKDDYIKLCEEQVIVGIPKSWDKDKFKAAMLAVRPDLKNKFLDEARNASSRQWLSKGLWDKIARCKRSLEQSKAVNKLVTMPGRTEELGWVYHEELDVVVTFKMDKKTDSGIIIDLKKTPSAEERDFQRKIYHEKLHIQAAGYMWVMRGIEPARAFVFAAYELSRPFIWQGYVVDAGTLDAGEAMFVKGLMRFKECKKKNHWPGYSEKLIDIALPHYAWSQIEYDAEKELDN